MKITKRQLRQIIKEEFRSREGKRLTRARYNELTDELDELYARLEKAKTMQEPNRSAHLQFYQNAINSLQGYLAFARAEGLSESRTARITKQRLRKIVKEEKQRILKERYGSDIETGSDIIEFAQSYCSLGTAVQQQVDAVVSAYFNKGVGADFEDVVNEQNPNAIDLAVSRLYRYSDNEEIQEVIDAIDAAQAVYYNNR
jgi:hypothetical protein